MRNNHKQKQELKTNEKYPMSFLEAIEFSQKNTSQLLGNILGKDVKVNLKQKDPLGYRGPPHANNSINKSVRFSFNQNLTESIRSLRSKNSRIRTRNRVMRKNMNYRRFEEIDPKQIKVLSPNGVNVENGDSISMSSNVNSLSKRGGEIKKNGGMLIVNSPLKGMRRALTQKEDNYRSRGAFMNSRHSPVRRFSRNVTDNVPKFAFDHLGEEIYQNEDIESSLDGSRITYGDKGSRAICSVCYIECSVCEELDDIGTPIASQNSEERLKKSGRKRELLIEVKPVKGLEKTEDELNKKNPVHICKHGKVKMKRCPLHQKKKENSERSTSNQRAFSPQKNSKNESPNMMSPVRYRGAEISQPSTKSGTVKSTYRKLFSLKSPKLLYVETNKEQLEPKHSIIKEEDSSQMNKKESSSRIDSSQNDKEESPKNILKKSSMYSKTPQQKNTSEKSVLKRNSINSKKLTSARNLRVPTMVEPKSILKENLIRKQVECMGFSVYSRSRAHSIRSVMKKKVRFAEKDKVYIVDNYKQFNKPFVQEKKQDRKNCCSRFFGFFISSTG